MKNKINLCIKTQWQFHTSLVICNYFPFWGVINKEITFLYFQIPNIVGSRGHVFIYKLDKWWTSNIQRFNLRLHRNITYRIKDIFVWRLFLPRKVVSEHLIGPHHQSSKMAGLSSFGAFVLVIFAVFKCNFAENIPGVVPLNSHTFDKVMLKFSKIVFMSDCWNFQRNNDPILKKVLDLPWAPLSWHAGLIMANKNSVLHVLIVLTSVNLHRHH